MVLVQVGPHVAVRVCDHIACVVLNDQGRVLAEPGAQREGEDAPRRVLVELREAARHKTTEKRHFL